MPFLPSADGTLIYAEAVGDASKPALVFIHGLALGLLGHHKSAMAATVLPCTLPWPLPYIITVHHCRDGPCYHAMQRYTDEVTP